MIFLGVLSCRHIYLYIVRGASTFIVDVLYSHVVRKTPSRRTLILRYSRNLQVRFIVVILTVVALLVASVLIHLAASIHRVVRALVGHLVFLEMVVEALDPLVFVVRVWARPMFTIGRVVVGRSMWTLLFISRVSSLCLRFGTMCLQILGSV